MSGNSFKARIRAYRKLKGLTQSQMAYKLGVSSSTLRNWETGRTKPSGVLNVRHIAETLSVKVDWLTGKADINDVSVGEVPDREKSASPVDFMGDSDVLYSYMDYDEIINPEDYQITEVEAPEMEVKKVGDEVVFNKLADPQLHLIIERVEYDANGEKVRESGRFVRILMKPKKP